MKLKMLFCALFYASLSVQAQEYFPKNDGVKAGVNTNFTVFKNATIHVDPSKTIENGMFAVKDGKISAIGKSINIPSNSVVIDLKGKEVYPSFIDLYTNFGIKKPEGGGGSYRSNPQYEPSREGYYWNDHIRPETTALENFEYSTSEAEELRKLGFGVVNTHMPDGIIRGTGMLVALNSEGTEGDRILDQKSAQYLSFSKSAKSKQVYPSSTMGVMALLRQTYLDADWYSRGNSNTKDLALEALNNNKNLVQIFVADDLLNELRADKVGDEFNIQYIIAGTGDEYRRLDAVKATNATYIVPLKFPEAFDMEDPYQAGFASLEDMKRWNQAPANLKLMAENGIPFTLTAFGEEKSFKENLLKAVQYGLDKKTALAALTTVPAGLIGKENELGTLKEGAWANFIITSGDYFEEETTLYENWVQGRRSIIEDMNTVNLNGTYDVAVAGKTYEMKVTGEPAKPKAEITSGETKIGSKVNYKDNWINLLLSSPDTTKTEYIRLTAKVPENPDNFSGKAILEDGSQTTFTATRTASAEEEKKKQKDSEVPEVLPVTFPNKAYGFETLPEQEDMLFRNATVWTGEDAGILENTDVLVRNGKISKVGKNLSAGRATVIDATGKHLTAGIIDEHSHIAASAVNEAGHNSSAEVNMEDVVDPDDIGIYRNLGGGVTTMQLLHGSANPIGGRSAILKMKWGHSPEEMIIDNSPKYIKFALGENVKQANWASDSRFPQTRMGVEQVFVDYFTRAKEYEAKKNSGQPYRKDIEMETILEVLNGERFVTAHSYVQSEINMLMKVAEQFDFNINTFTHILEGYKLADKMREHGVGGSTFSDWWAYKYEVNDAIPQNASIMHNAGVTVAINSDDSEMSRRLNQEAAKSMKYGDVSEEEAWKFVTLNPAKLLHIDDRVGSIKEGKDADLVLWTDHPLSVYAKAEKTIIEGAVYFDLERDAQLREEIESQKNLLTTQMLNAKNNGVKTQPVKATKREEFHCNSL